MSSISNSTVVGLLRITILAFMPFTVVKGEDAATKVLMSTGPVPNWVEPLEWQISTENPTGEAAESILLDAQHKLFANGGDYYYHNVIRLLTPRAVADQAQQLSEITPDFDSVTWHIMKVYRDGKVIDRLPTTQFRKLQREPQLEAQVLTGVITYAAVLDDIQVGDIIETAHTLHFTNPLMAGRTGGRTFLGSSNPALRQRVIIRLPRDLGDARTSFVVPSGTLGLPDVFFRQVSLLSALEDRSTDSERVYQWEGRKLPAIEFDERIAPRAYPYWPMFVVTTFTSWSDVVEWAANLFVVPEKLPEPLMPLIAQWKKEPDQAKRIDAAVTWAQNDVRYFALDLARNPVKPRPLIDVCTSRFGDCKDKALLLTTILRALGVEAWPALTNTYFRDRLNELRPDARAFNHAIVAYRYSGQLRWVDPSLSQQHGRGARWNLPRYRAALIVRPGESTLSDCTPEPLVEPDAETIDHITVDAKTGDAQLSTKITLRGLQADFYRPSLTTTTAAERGKSWFNFISTFYRRLEEEKAPVCEDSADRDEITITAEYRLPAFVHRENGESSAMIYAYALRAIVDVTGSRRRHWPYALPEGRYVRHRIEAELPFELPPGQLPELIRAPGFQYRIERGAFDHRLVVQHDLRITADSVSAEEMPQFADDLDELMANLSTGVHAVKRADATPSAAGQPAATPPASNPRTPSTSETH